MSELILAVGDDNVKFQNLDQCATDLNYNYKAGTKITFGTDQPVNLDGTVKLGLVVWLDRKLVATALAGEITPAPVAAKDAEIARLRAVMERCAEIVDRNLYRQHEKVEDVPKLLRAALTLEQGREKP